MYVARRLLTTMCKHSVESTVVGGSHCWGGLYTPNRLEPPCHLQTDRGGPCPEESLGLDSQKKENP